MAAEIVIRVFIPLLKVNKCITVIPSEKILVAKNKLQDKEDVALGDSQNFAFYLPSKNASGEFLDEERTLQDYCLEGHVPKLEFRRITRDYGGTSGLTERKVVKMNSKPNLKKFIDYVRRGEVKKVDKMLSEGLDPNFVTDDGNTPLGIACGRDGKPSVILSLVHGGANMMFRGKDGLTPLHRAAIGGNNNAIDILMDQGASPNYKDAKGLTPLYHTTIMGDIIPCHNLLMRYSEVDVVDSNLYTELHQAAKHGHCEQIDLLVQYGASLGAKNSLGNTPLHVAASQGQIDAVRVLLKRGAEKDIGNNLGNPPNQVAIICGHHQAASVIVNFLKDAVEPILEKPKYHYKTSFRPQVKWDPVDKDDGDRGVGSPKSPIVDSIMKDLMSDEKELTPSQRLRAQSVPAVSQTLPRQTRRPTEGTVASLPPPPTRTPPGSPMKRFLVVEDYTPTKAGELLVKKGMTVEVIQTRHDGLCQVQSGSRIGWVHMRILKEVPQSLPIARPPPAHTHRKPSQSSSEPSTTTLSSPRPGEERIVTVHFSNKGYGFSMRGVKSSALALKSFRPTPQIPALQYIHNVDPGSSADQAGLHIGDFLLEVNNCNVVMATHDEVVDIVRRARGGPLALKVMYSSAHSVLKRPGPRKESVPEGGLPGMHTTIRENPSSNHTADTEVMPQRHRLMSDSGPSTSGTHEQRLPQRQRLMSEPFAGQKNTRRHPPPPPTVQPLREDPSVFSPLSGSSASLHSNTSTHSNSSQRGNPSGGSQPSTPPEDRKEGLNVTGMSTSESDEPLTPFAQALKEAVRKRSERQMEIEDVKEDTEDSSKDTSSHKQPMSTIQMQHVKNKTENSPRKESSTDSHSHSPLLEDDGEAQYGNPITSLLGQSRQSGDILTKLMAIVGQDTIGDDQIVDQKEDGLITDDTLQEVTPPPLRSSTPPKQLTPPPSRSSKAPKQSTPPPLGSSTPPKQLTPPPTLHPFTFPSSHGQVAPPTLQKPKAPPPVKPKPKPSKPAIAPLRETPTTAPVPPAAPTTSQGSSVSRTSLGTNDEGQFDVKQILKGSQFQRENLPSVVMATETRPSLVDPDPCDPMNWSQWAESVNTEGPRRGVADGGGISEDGDSDSITGDEQVTFTSDAVMESWGNPPPQLDSEEHLSQDSLNIDEIPLPVVDFDILPSEDLPADIPPSFLPPPLPQGASFDDIASILDNIVPPPLFEVGGVTTGETSTDMTTEVHPLPLDEGEFPNLSFDLPPPLDMDLSLSINPTLSDDDTLQPNDVGATELSVDTLHPPLPAENLILPPNSLEDTIPLQVPAEEDISPLDLESPVSSTQISLDLIPPPFSAEDLVSTSRMSVILDAPVDFQITPSPSMDSFDPSVLPPAPFPSETQTKTATIKEEESDIPPPPPTTAPPIEEISDSLPPFLNDSHEGLLTGPEDPILHTEDDVFGSNVSLASREEEKYSSTPPSMRAPFSRYSISLENETIGIQISLHEDFHDKPLSSWTVENVCEWLKEIGLEEHVETFKDNEIIGEHLMDMTKDDLKELGIRKIGHRKTIASKIQHLLRVQNL